MWVLATEGTLHPSQAYAAGVTASGTQRMHFLSMERSCAPLIIAGPPAMASHSARPPALLPPPSRRQQQAAWRQEDLEQRQLENARALWARAVEKNRHDAPCAARLGGCCIHEARPRCASSATAGALAHASGQACAPLHPPRRRDVEERAEQLKAISSLSALIAGFVLTAFLQFDFAPSASSEGVQLAFGVTIAITVMPAAADRCRAVNMARQQHGWPCRLGRSMRLCTAHRVPFWHSILLCLLMPDISEHLLRTSTQHLSEHTATPHPHSPLPTPRCCPLPARWPWRPTR